MKKIRAKILESLTDRKVLSNNLGRGTWMKIELFTLLLAALLLES